ncbi:GLIPR1-like protein 1 [Schistosoma haematobium]|nr:GLIPR1-like protein 1 [Schistosoma haematobium]KAH9581340.1 GLIPR1-like protein 1 [Schistosoma haematobium]
MNDTIRGQLLTMHNVVRQLAMYGLIPGQPKAVYMNPLRWNMELEKKAQNLSDQCKSEHDKNDERRIQGFQYVGQTWAGAYKVERAVQLWFSEVAYYNFTTNKCSSTTCGNYPQLVWENTTDVGCGVTNCRNFKTKLVIVCNYGPGGDVFGQRPYRTV